MIKLFEQDIQRFDRQSSKGNQLKWENNGIWYKADYTGYEGLAEYMISHLLVYSALDSDEYVTYDPEEISYRNRIYRGAKSNNFLQEGQQLITLERLIKNLTGQSLYQSIFRISEIEERFRFLVNQVERYTGLDRFDVYLNKLFTIDALFLNEDRHMHNIAVIMNPDETFSYCPVFDNGAGLLADTSMDYPMGEDVLQLMSSVHSKSIAWNFDEQLDVSEKVSKTELKFRFTQNDVERLLSEAVIYSEEERQRVKTVIFQQMRKYAYLFS